MGTGTPEPLPVFSLESTISIWFYKNILPLQEGSENVHELKVMRQVSCFLFFPENKCTIFDNIITLNKELETEKDKN